MIENKTQWSDALMAEWLSTQQKYINELFDKVVGIGGNYLSLAEQIYASQEQGASEIDLQPWLDKTDELYRDWSSQLTELLNQPDKEPVELSKANWAAWRKLSRTAFNVCENLQSSFGDFKIPGADVAQDSFFNLLDMAKSVLFRKTEQEVHQHLARFNRYKRANAAYSLILANNGIQAIAILKEKISEANAADKLIMDANSGSDADQAEDIRSLKALYELWVQINETVYAKSALSPEYQSAYGELINSYMLFKKDMDDSLAEHYKHLNLTSKTELDCLLVSHKALQSENKQLRRQVNDLVTRIEVMEKKS